MQILIHHIGFQNPLFQLSWRKQIIVPNGNSLLLKITGILVRTLQKVKKYVKNYNK